MGTSDDPTYYTVVGRGDIFGSFHPIEVFDGSYEAIAVVADSSTEAIAKAIKLYERMRPQASSELRESIWEARRVHDGQ